MNHEIKVGLEVQLISEHVGVALVNGVLKARHFGVERESARAGGEPSW